MKIIFRFFLIGCFIIIFILGNVQLNAGTKGEQKKEWPKVGSIYKYSGVEWYVRGVGNKPFEYTATGESLSLVIEGTPGTIVMVPKKGQKVRCDPTVPMVYVNNVPDPDLNRNSYFKKKAKNKVFLLLEYKRN